MTRQSGASPEDLKDRHFEGLLDELEDGWSEHSDWNRERDNHDADFDWARIDTARSRLTACVARLEAEIAEAREILASGVDRDRDPKDTLRTLAVVASNGIYWRDQSISAQCGILKNGGIMTKAEEKEYLRKRDEAATEANTLRDVAIELLGRARSIYDQYGLDPQRDRLDAALNELEPPDF